MTRLNPKTAKKCPDCGSFLDRYKGKEVCYGCKGRKDN